MKKGKKRKWQGVIQMLAFMGLGAVCGVMIAVYAERTLAHREMGEVLFGIALLFVSMYLSIMIQIVIHEAGHLVFGLLSGYQFSSFRIFSFMWMREEGKIKVKRMSIAGTGGQCLMSPPDLIDGKIPYVMYNLGGSVMNLLTAAVFGLFSLLSAGHFVISVFCMLTALAGVIFALLNGVPMHTDLVDNDGYNALQLGKNKEALASFWLQMKVNAQIAKGMRLKDLPEEWFRVPDEEGMKNSMTAAVGVFACSRLIDEGRFEEARDLIHKLLAADTAILELHRRLMACDEICCMAAAYPWTEGEKIRENGGDPETETAGGQDLQAGAGQQPDADGKLSWEPVRKRMEEMMDRQQKKFMKSMKQYPSVLRTGYIYALTAENNRVKADKIKSQFEKAARVYPYQSDLESERYFMQYIDERCGKHFS